MKKLSLEQHEFDVIREVFAERLLTLRETITKNGDKLDKYERDIRNYTTYDIHCKLMAIDTDFPELLSPIMEVKWTQQQNGTYKKEYN